MTFPIKYIENNLIKNGKGDWWAYYRLEPYNYSFLSQNEKMQSFYKLSQLLTQTKKGDIHFLQLSVDENMRAAMERSKKCVSSGALAETAYKRIEMQTEVLIDGVLFEEPESDRDIPFFTGETQIDYRFYVGFRLVPFDEDLKSKINFYKQMFLNLNHSLAFDYYSVPKEEIERYMRIENLTYSRISSLFNFSPVDPEEIAYICEHLNGLQGLSLDDYVFPYSLEDYPDCKKVQTYDLLKLDNVLIRETPKHLCLESENGTQYVAYLSYSDLVGENEFPGCEVLFSQQSVLHCSVDTSIKLRVIPNKTAIKDVRNKKKTLNDMDNHAADSGNDTEMQVYEALDDVKDLEAYLQETKDVMFEMSYLVRVTASDQQTLEKNVNEVRDFYDGFNIKLERSAGDMFVYHSEFFPSAERKNTIVRRVDSTFVASLGFGAAQDIGEKEGIAIGYIPSSDRFFYLKPWLAAQGVDGAITNSLSAAFIGSLGWGKSFSSNLLLYLSVLYGAWAVVLDPKSERGLWAEMLPEIADYINIINLTSDEKNRGILDPFLLMRKVTDAENLALDILSFLLGISIRDSQKYPALRRAIKNVGQKDTRGLLLVIDELRKENTDVSIALADHIEGFVDIGLAQLLFSDGTNKNTISFDKQLNIIQIADLVLPDKSTNIEDYTPTEMLSVTMMIVISTFCLDFIHSGSDQFKIVDIDEAWSLLNINQGRILSNKLVREGRSMNAGSWFSTQNAKDIDDESIKNNIGMFFVFHSEDEEEIEHALKLLGLDYEDEGNKSMISSLGVGECVMKDIYGRINKVKFECLLPDLKHAFNTKPKMKSGDMNESTKNK